ncbi:hypothetical protein DERP_000008 [Dermatophagoides pteronyssinus]|uniref:Uncharacterized protein n=1 Tax=Dermatophagoides pteronyssinus TaxID=6956 RepID=A0ABQ8IYY0_DERPT|nr:hypothetical protein DERP_000008 [Dermatophagoides pteronyssinus]
MKCVCVDARNSWSEKNISNFVFDHHSNQDAHTFQWAARFCAKRLSRSSATVKRIPRPRGNET